MSKLKKSEHRMRKSAVEFVRDVFNISKVKRVFRIGAEVFSAVQPVIEKPSSLNIASAAFRVGKVIVDDLELWPDDYFDESWESPYPTDFNKILLGALANKPYKVIRTSSEADVIHMVHIDDVRFGYVLNSRTNTVNGIYVEIDKLEKSKEIIKTELWKMMKDDNIVLRHVRRPNGNYDSNISLDVDDAFQPMPSKRATEYASYLKKCIDAGVSRSVMLYGPPGTGKSTMARTIVNNLGMKSFRIRVEDIGHLESNSIFEAINIFEPDAVILDDFDRSDSQAQLLETLEFFQRHVKLVISTVNNKSRLDEAILRPGRFDELVQIKQMDEDVVKMVLGDDLASNYELVKDWPIAFIQEFVKRLRFMTPQEAAESVKELAARVKRLRKYDDESDEVSIDKMLTGSRQTTDAQDFIDDMLRDSNTSVKKVRKKKRQ